ncbi:hypothetical protein AB0D71_22935 [Streptomyces avermitilis]|uniref:hypothetical protein n=1 Tax=Streptomyces avermitilis TaxID=33903 RepID=UPI0033D5DD13
MFFTFLWQRGLNWDEATEEDVEDWEDWRLRGVANPAPVGGGTWAKEQAALKLLYRIAAKRGLVPVNPVQLASPSDVKTSDVKWLSPRAFRLWRNVGLGGMLPSGLEDESWRGRCAGRDMAYADLMYSSSPRPDPATSNLTPRDETQGQPVAGFDAFACETCPRPVSTGRGHGTAGPHHGPR